MKRENHLPVGDPGELTLNGLNLDELLERAAQRQLRLQPTHAEQRANAWPEYGQDAGPESGPRKSIISLNMMRTASDARIAPVAGNSSRSRGLDFYLQRLSRTQSSRASSFSIDPLQDPRWATFVEEHPRSSVFHSIPWLQALQQTYGYQPIVHTTSGPGERLRDGIVFCRVESWITGRRLVSLPFSDHCEPLVDDPSCLYFLLSTLQERFKTENWKSMEIRPVQRLEVSAGLRPVDGYYLHWLDLYPDVSTLFANLHQSSTRRKIQRAEREALTYRDGHSDSLLEDFYQLLLLTRRRHGLPPQPRSWFRNLKDSFGKCLKIRVAYRGALPIASIITIQHQDTLVYKYGCSDAGFHNLGGMHLLLWTSILEAKSEGLRTFDLGRSDLGNMGLITFKDRWGAVRSPLTYYQYSKSPSASGSMSFEGPDWRAWLARVAKPVFSCIPDRFISAAGTLLYKHIG